MSTRRNIQVRENTIILNSVFRDKIEADQERGDHCLDYLRQIIQCHGDVDLIPFEHVVEKQVYRPTFNYTRTCVRYEPLEKWVDEHRAGNNTPDGQV